MKQTRNTEQYIQNDANNKWQKEKTFNFDTRYYVDDVLTYFIGKEMTKKLVFEYLKEHKAYHLTQNQIVDIIYNLETNLKFNK